jgi:hypothetical protein
MCCFVEAGLEKGKREKGHPVRRLWRGSRGDMMVSWTWEVPQE